MLFGNVANCSERMVWRLVACMVWLIAGNMALLSVERC